MWNSKIDVPLYIGSEEIRTGNTRTMSAPHDHKHIVGTYHLAEKPHIEKAIANALESSMGKHGLGTASCHFLESGRIDCRSIQSKNKRGN
jgi:hypothetical protein